MRVNDSHPADRLTAVTSAITVLTLRGVGVLCAFAQCACAQDYTQPKAWNSSSLTGNPIAVRNSSAKLYGTYGTNKSQCPRYVKVFDKKAADVKLGTDKPVATFELPPGTNRWFPESIERKFGNGLTFACTKHKEDTDTKGAPVNECFATAVYK